MIRIKLLAFVLAIFQFSFASAAVHYVTESGTGDASSWGAAGNLHTALTTAAFGDEIWIAGGNYFPHASDATVRYEISTANLSIYGGFNGVETSLMERDFVNNPTVLSGEIQNDANDQNNTDIVFSVNAANTIVDGLIIEKGYGSSGGGGIWQSSSALYAEYHNLILRNNKSVTNGGAMSLPNSGTSANIYNCVFENNSVDGASSDVGALIAQAKVEIYNSIFVGNSAVRNQGAALFYTTGGGKVVNCVFYNNTAASTQDGGINIAVTYEVKNSIFWDNTAPSSPNVNFAAGVTSSHCIIQGASSASWPGGTFGSDGGNNENLDPMFSDNVNPAGADGKWFTADDGLMLSASSPAIDKASAGGLTQDILGNLYVGPADIGAYEYLVSGTALRFDGVDDYVNIPETASLTWSGNLSVSAWIMMDPSSSGAERAIVSKYNGTSGFMFSVSTGDKLALTVGNGSTDLLEDSTPLPMGVWLHVATTFDSISQTMMLYVDGQPVAQKVASVGLDNNNGASMRIARFTHTTGGFFTGMMDEVSVWDRVIDVTSFGKMLPAGDVNLLGGYNFDNGTGTTAIDIRALNDGSIIGGAAWVGSGANPKALPQVWYVKSTPLGSMDGSDWSSAANIEDALLLAKPGDEIWMGSGNYTPVGTDRDLTRFQQDQNNVTIYGGFSGTETSLFQRDITLNQTILSGDIGTIGIDTDNAYTVFFINSANVIVDGLIFENGRADGTGTDQKAEGGGVYLSLQAHNIKLSKCIFRNNYALHGAAISNRNYSAGQVDPLLLENCVFENNYASGSGGAIHTMGPLTAVHSIYYNNTAAGSGGGAIAFNMSGSSGAGNIMNTIFYNNSTPSNGVHLVGDSPNLTVQNSILWGGTSAGGEMIYKTGGAATTNNSILMGASSGAWPAGFWGNDGGANSDADPMFSDNVNPMGADGIWFTMDDGLRIQTGSPAIDAGINLGLGVDIIGNPIVGAPDIGAYEGGVNPPPTLYHVLPVAAGSGDGSDWANGANLHMALSNALAGDTIWVANGGNHMAGSNRNASFDVGMGVKILGGFMGNEMFESQRNPIDNPTILSGDIGAVGDVTDNSFTIMLINGSNVILDGLIFEGGYGVGGANNVENEGGAIHLNTTASNVTIQNSIFRNNLSQHGGAISNRNSNSQTTDFTIINCVFANNTAQNSSGALHSMGPTDIVNSVFANNNCTTNQGGAITFNMGSGHHAYIKNSTFYNNSTVGNTAHVWSDASTFNISNSIFWGGSSADNLPFSNNGESTLTATNSLVEGSPSVSWVGGLIGTDGGNNIDGDPMFSDNVNLKGVDGKWFTSDDGLRLLSGSPAIDAGVSIAGLTTDITGIAHAGAPDIGAYEGGVTPPPSLSLVPNSGFTPLTEIATNTTNAIALIFDLDTQNVGYSGNLTEITFPVTLANPSVEFTGALVYELSQGGQLVSNTPVFSGTNISFYGLNHAVSSAGNTTLELKLTTGGTFTGTNVHVEIQPTGFKFEDGAMVTGSPIATGNVALVDPFQGVSFAAGIGAEPTSFNQGDTGITLIDMDFNLANGSAGEVVDKIKISFSQGFVGSDLDMLEVWVSGTKVGELNDFGSTWATNSTLGLPINGPTTVEIRANISPTAPSGNLSYDVSGSLMLLAGGNILVQPPVGIANIAPINPAVVSSMLTFNSQTPPNGATNVNPSDNLTLTFDEGLSGLGAGIFRIYENGSATYSYGSGSSELIINGSTLVIDPATDLLDSSNYYVTIDANMIVGLSGNQFGGFASSSEWAFTTGAGNSSSNTMTSAHRLALAQHAVYAISPSGNLSGDGDNSRYQIDSSFPMKVYGGPDFGPSQVEAVKAGAEHLMIQKAGSVYVTGSNDFGQSQGYTSLTPITGLTNIGLIEAGAYSCYAYDTSDQFLYVWGKNSSGMLGNGTQNDVSSPINITKPSGELTAMSAGVDHFLVIIGGALYGVGSDAYGQLAGIGSQTSLALIDNTMTWKEVGAGGFHSLAVTTTGELYVFGKNHQGQLGLGTTSPTVAGLTQVTGLSPVAEVAAGYDHSMIRMDDGRALGVGSNAQQQLGDFMSPQSLSWYDIGAYTDVMDIACGPYTSVFIRNDGTMEYVKLFGLLMDGPTANINVFKSYSVSNP